MPSKYKRKTPDKGNLDEQIKSAIAKVQSKELSIRKAAKEIGLPESTLRDKIKKHHTGTWGGSNTLPKEVEQELALMLSIKAKWGFAAGKEELKDIVQQYVSSNKYEATPIGQQIATFCRFKVKM